MTYLPRYSWVQFIHKKNVLRVANAEKHIILITTNTDVRRNDHGHCKPFFEILETENKSVYFSIIYSQSHGGWQIRLTIIERVLLVKLGFTIAIESSSLIFCYSTRSLLVVWNFFWFSFVVVYQKYNIFLDPYVNCSGGSFRRVFYGVHVIILFVIGREHFKSI